MAGSHSGSFAVSARYVPTVLCEQLCRDTHAVTAPQFVTRHGAVLFADISGFTQLAEHLALRGPDGAELLTAYLDSALGELVEIVTTHGGDVLKFAGDALLALWAADETADLGEPALRSAACAWAIQQAAEARAHLDAVHLLLRVTISAGPLFLCGAGGVLGKRELLVWGDPLRQLAAARDGLQPSEVGVSSEVLALLGGRIQTSTSAGGGHRLIRLRETPQPRPTPAVAIDPAAEAALLQYVPGAILGRVQGADARWLGELRHVAVMFAKFPAVDSAASPVDIAQQAQAMMEVLQKAVYQFEGSVNKLSVDEKGMMLLAVWGLPPLAHEDDPTRAVRAALAVHDQLTAASAKCAVGIATGTVYCGVIGHSARAEYTVIGDAVNIAARLADASPQEIWCDAATAQKAAGDLEFESLAPFAAKGKAKPIAVRRPTGGTVERVQPRTVLIGRARETAAIAEFMHACLRASGQRTLVFEAPAGMGKSRLVREVLDRATSLSITPLVGSAAAVEQHTAYHALRPVFAALFGIASHDSVAAAKQRVLDQLAHWPHRLERAPLLQAVLTLDLPETELTAQLAGEPRADNTCAYLAALLQDAAQRKPLVVVIEDCHWLDRLTWAVLRAVVRDAPRVGVVLATRPMEPPTPDYLALLGHPSTARFALDTMTQAEMRALVCQRLGVVRMPDEVADLIFAKAEGNPFFSEEIAYALRDANLIKLEGGQCWLAPEVGDLRALRLPDTVQGMVTSRVDRLSPAQQMALKVGSVLGHIFALGILRDLYPVAEDRQELPALLDPLVERDLLRALAVVAERQWSFKHNITQEAVYNLMLYAQRRELHHKAAGWIEARYAHDLAPHYPLLAHHWTRAEQWPRAVHFLELAGQQALDRFANQAAIRFFGQAIELDRQHALGAATAKLAYWQRALSQAHYGASQLVVCADHTQQALALLGWPAPASTLGTFRGLLGQLALRIWQRYAPRFVPRLGAEQRQRHLWGVHLHTRLSEFYLYSQNVLGMLYSGLREINLAEPAGPCAELGRAYATMSAILGAVPLRAIAEACAVRGEQNAATAQPPDRAFIFLRCASYGVYAAQWQRCHRWLAEAATTGSRIGDGKLWQDATTISAIIAHFRGDFGLSAQLFADLQTAAAAKGLEQGRNWGLLGEGMALVRLGRAEDGLARLEAAMPWVTAEATPPEVIWAHGFKALAHLRLGDTIAARRHADQALAVVEAARPTAYWTQPATAAMCEVYGLLAAAAGFGPDRKTAAHRFARGVRGMVRFGAVFPFGQPHALYWRGKLAQFGGSPQSAGKWFARSLAMAERLQTRYEAGLACRELAMLADGAEAATLADRAAALLTECGVPPNQPAGAQ